MLHSQVSGASTGQSTKHGYPVQMLRIQRGCTRILSSIVNAKVHLASILYLCIPSGGRGERKLVLDTWYLVRLFNSMKRELLPRPASARHLALEMSAQKFTICAPTIPPDLPFFPSLIYAILQQSRAVMSPCLSDPGYRDGANVEKFSDCTWIPHLLHDLSASQLWHH